MADQRPLCEIKIEPDGSISFETLESLSDECRIPPTLKSVDIPIDAENDADLLKPATVKAMKSNLPVAIPITDKQSVNTVNTVEPAKLVKLVSAVVVPSQEVIPKPPPSQPMTPTVVVAIAAVGSAASSMATKLVQDFIKKQLKGRKKGKDSKTEESGEEEENHKNCSVQRISMQRKIDTLDSRLSSLQADYEELTAQHDELKQLLEEANKGSKLPDWDPQEMEDRLEKIEKILKKAKLR